MITIDQRGCGQGKTTDGIYKRLASNHKNKIKSLVVVPSIQLQQQYVNDLDIPIHLINSDLYNQQNQTTTVKATLDSLKLGIDTIIITHKTFTMLPVNRYTKQYDLIIDEALDEVIKKTTITSVNNDQWNPDYDLGNIFSFKDELVEQIVELSTDDDENWYELHMDRMPSYSLLSDSPSFKTITDKNYIHYVTPHGWRVLNNQDGGIINVISTLNIDLLKYYRSVHIAAAAFDKTKMYHWMKANGLQLNVTKKFNPHKGNIKIWASDNNQFKWSNTKRKNNPSILKDYHDLVNRHATGTVISIRNNGETNRLQNEINVGHSVHGLNNKKLQDCNNISLESALIMDSQTKKFVTDNWLSDQNRYEMERSLTHMNSAYLFYQVIMRTKLRNRDYDGELINVFVLDQNTAVCLTDYFETITDVGELNITSNFSISHIGRPRISEEEKKQKNRERCRRYRLKQMAKKQVNGDTENPL